MSIRAQPGFGGVFRLGEPLPLRVELVNSGAAVRGVLEVEEARGGPTRGIPAYSFLQRRDVFLSAHARKVVFLTVDPDSVARPLWLRFTGAGRTHEASVSLRGRFTGQPLVLLLTRSNVAPAIPLSREAPTPVVSLPLTDLPEDPRAYGGVWSVMLYEQSLRGLSGRQRSALERWLSSGGVMAALGGVHYALYRDPATAGLLPVEVRGLKRLDALPDLSARLGGSLEDVLVQQAAATRGTVLLAERDTPILVERSHGQGRVAYLALDVGRPPVADWAGLPALFEEMLGAPPPRPSDPWNAWSRDVFTGLLQDFGFVSLRSPMLSLLLLLALYVGSLLLWFRLWKAGPRSRRGLAFAPAGLVLASALGGYGYFDRGGYVPDGVLISSTVVDESPWSETAAAHSDVGLFATRRRDFSFSLGPGWTQLDLAPAADEGSKASLVLRQGGPRDRVHVPLAEWSAALFKLRSVRPSSVRVDWEQSRDLYRVGIANRSAGPLTECWLVVEGRGYALGDVPPGGSLRREVPAFPDAARSGEGEGPEVRDVRFDEAVRGVLMRRALFPDGDAPDPRTAFVVGWFRDGEPALRVEDPRVTEHHYRMFRVAVPLGGAEEDP